MSLLYVDSSSDLDYETLKKMGVEIISLPYYINEQRMEFGEDFDYKKFYSKFKKGLCIESFEISLDEYKSIFEQCLSQGDDFVYVHSSKNIFNLENLYKAIDELKEKYPERTIKLVDSANISIGTGLITYLATLLYKQGDSTQEIADKIDVIKDEYATYFVCDNTEQLCNEGVIEKSMVTGTTLNIKPIFTIDIDGKLRLVEKASGKKKAIQRILEICRQTGENVADNLIGISYTSDEASAMELKTKIQDTFGKDIKLFVNQISPSNAATLGNGILALSFHIHKKTN